MASNLENNLLTYKKSTISIDDLEKLSTTTTTYETFAKLVMALEEDRKLVMVKSTGRNNRTPSLAYRYRINRQALNRIHHQNLQRYRMKFHNAIRIDTYFHMDITQWEADLPYLEKINDYIIQNGFPNKKEPAPGRSFQLVGDEKWLEQGGAEVLRRVNLFEKMNIYPVSDPLMLAVNPHHINQAYQLHLIVENKTTYQALVPVLTQTAFSTLIYGEGNKITKSIENFPDQYPVTANHRFHYFGDVDRTGISIWYRLQQRTANIIPAYPFYELCLTKIKAYGKTNQRWDEQAIRMFIESFPKESQMKLRQLLEDGAYYPQEALQTTELQEIFMQKDWLR